MDNYFIKYLNSCFSGENLTVKKFRIIKSIFYTIWLLGIIFILFNTYIITNSIPKYLKANDLSKELPEIERKKRNYEESKNHNYMTGGTGFSYSGGWDYNKLIEAGIDDKYSSIGYDDFDLNMPNKLMNAQQSRIIDSLVSIFGLIFLLLVLPWLVIKFYFYIKKADNQTKNAL